MSRYLGVDFGAKRIGLALSDQSFNFAFPFKVLENTPNFLDDIVKICEENNVELIVIGDSKDFSMKDNKIMEEIKKFIKNFEKVSSIKIVLHPEFMTSQEAEKLQSRRLRSGSRVKSKELKNYMLDASAAALILKSYLDSNKK